MDLTTRCPKCGTVFKAGLSDLQLRKGYIRCVQCAHIFDGYAEVVSDNSASSRPAAPTFEESQPVDETSAPQVFRYGRHQEAGQDDDFSIGDAMLPDAGPKHSLGSIEQDEPPLRQDPAQQYAAGQEDAFIIEPRHDRQGHGGSAAPLIHAEDGFLWLDGLLRLGGRVLISALLVLLAAQLVYVYRAQIAQAVPALRPHLERACISLHCQVPYARDISRMAISSSALKLDDIPQSQDTDSAQDQQKQQIQQEQHFILELMLRNQAEYPQEWPALVLDLNDAAGTRIVRRNLSAAEYLGDAVASHPFAAGSEVRVRVPLTLTGLQINGYQLDLFFP